MLKGERLVIKYSKRVLVDIAFEIEHSLALVGQSGSGKSLTLKALLGLLPSNLEVQLDYDAPFELKAGKSISFIPQSPFGALSPLTKIKHQFLIDKAQAAKRLMEVGLDTALLERYPSELSGGQLQRVVIAIALEHTPKIVLLDEPTTALDAKNSQMILDLLARLQEQMRFLILFVTHQIAAASKLCRHICVIKEGQIVEKGDSKALLKHPRTPYTKQLIEADFAKRRFRQ